MTERPEAETMGWWPAGERWMIARRRWPNAMPAAGSTQTPASSGPRWPTAAAMAAARAVMPSASRPRGSRKPAMPHIAIYYPPLVPKVVIVVNVDWFFVSHRLPLGVALRAAGFDVVVAAAPTGYARAIEEAGLRFVPLPLHRSGRAPWRGASSAAAVVALYRRRRPPRPPPLPLQPRRYRS